MIPQRTLAGTCEITTGALSITQRPPIYTGESAALKVEVSFTFQNVAYPLPSGVVAEMYLKFPNTEKMTVSVPMEISGNTASGVLTGEQTGLEGYPLLIIQLTDTETASLIVACATTVKVSDVRGNLVVDTRAPTPSEIVYVGRSPYIDPTTKHWITWDSEQAKYVDTGINAEGVIGYTPSISIGMVQSVPTGESAEVTRTGTDRNPVLNFKLPRSGDGVGIYPVSIPIAVAEWVEESGVYKYTLLDATIKSYMTVLESWLDDEAVQLGKVWYTINDGSLIVNTDVVPTAAWALHVTLGTDGTDVLEDVADLESRFPVSIANGGTGGTTAAEARQALGITGANVPTSAVSGQTNVDGALGLLSQQIETVNLGNIESISALQTAFDSLANGMANLQIKNFSFIPTFTDQFFINGSTYIGTVSRITAKNRLSIFIYNHFNCEVMRAANTSGTWSWDKMALSQQIENLEAAMAYAEEGDTATKKTYTEGEFIIWKGALYTVNSDGIPLNTAISGHVTAVTGGGLNKNAIKMKTFTVTTTEGGSFFIPDMYVSTVALLNVYVTNKNNYVNLYVTPSYNRFYCWATQAYNATPIPNTELQIQVIYIKL